VIVNWKEDLEEICCNFYNNLYKAQKEMFGQTKLKHRVLDSMPKIFTPTMNFKLTQPIVAKSMTRGKAPRPNGIILDFYIYNGT
jgi:hypothetical protein